ncbi:MAG: hypothetical protein LBS16_00170 [Prevotellaceae bacterium]|jgi:phosphoribosylglycinamide formyltransferase-1|nr:hypothetical protein [Prevotellaceae bacterium]
MSLKGNVQNGKIGVLTYAVPHRKTYDVLCLLKAKGYQNVEVYALPLHYTKRKFPLIEHRPPAPNIDPHEICNGFGYKYVKEFNVHSFPQNGIVLLCGGGILTPEIYNTFRVINSHPGYLPYVRGLDALKWAICEDLPIGVTTHRIGGAVDAGLVIAQETIPLYKNDSFHTLALRQYETEVRLMVDSIEMIDDASNYIAATGEIRKRMPPELEMTLVERFDEYKRKHS